MDPSLPSALSSLDDSLAQYCGSLGEISAAHSVDVAVVLGQLKAAAESAEALRSFIFSELPEASWESRVQLNAVLEQIQKNIETRRLEALRSRLLDLATELERGSVVHQSAGPAFCVAVCGRSRLSRLSRESSVCRPRTGLAS